MKNLLPMQAGDVPITYADVTALVNDVGFMPKTEVSIGLKRFVDWYSSTDAH